MSGLIHGFCMAFIIFAQTGAADEEQAKPEPRELPAFRQGLAAVPLPDLNKAEEVVGKYIGRFQNALFVLIRNYPDADMELGNAFGLLGDVYYAYQIRVSAEPCYQNAMTLQPEQFRWTYMLAALHQERGDIELAEPLFEKAAKMKPNYGAVWVRLGELRLQVNDYEAALGYYRKALDIDANMAAAHYGLGQAELIRRQFKESIPHFQKTLELVPQADRVHYSLALAYRGLGDMDTAKQHITRSGKVGIRPPDPVVDEIKRHLRGERVHLQRGKAAFAAGQYEDAAREFQKAVRSKPNSISAKTNLGATLGVLNQPNEAIIQFQGVLELEPGNTTAHYNLGFLMAELGRNEEAEKHLRLVLKANPDDGNAQIVLAKTLFRLGSFDEALSLYNEVKQPLDEESVINRSILLTQKDALKEARQCLIEGHERMPEKGRLAHALARFLASCPDTSLRDGLRALDLARKVVQANATVNTVSTLAMAYAEVGDCELAAEWQLKAIEAESKAENPGEALLDQLRQVLARYQAGYPCQISAP